jgi:hypothetical protein
MVIMVNAALPLPNAGDQKIWAYRDVPATSVRKGWELSFFVEEAQNPDIKNDQSFHPWLPLYFHDFHKLPALEVFLTAGNHLGKSKLWDENLKAMFQRLSPKLLNYGFDQELRRREFIFRGWRPTGLHLLERVLEGGCPFWLEDLSHFATHGEFLLEVLDTVGLSHSLSPKAILFAPMVDASYPFKFVLMPQNSQNDNRTSYVTLLKQLLRQSESDETFRARNFKEVMRGFQKFGAAAAMPAFQNIERHVWKLLSHIAARLRVKIGRLTDSTETAQSYSLLSELRSIHKVLQELIHLPSQMAAYFRTHFQLELEKLAGKTLTNVRSMADRVDCQLEETGLDFDAVVKIIYEFQKLGVASPRESLMLKDHDIKQSYTTEIMDWPESPIVRHYSDKIFTGARNYDKRRFRRDTDTYQRPDLDQEDLDIDLDAAFEFGEDSRSGGIHSGPFEISLDWED